MSGMLGKIGLVRLRRQVPPSADSAATRAHLARERAGLQDYNGAAIALAADVLQAMHGIGVGHVSELRADRLPRYRRGQLIGEYGLPVEDLCAMALESSTGREVVLSGLRVLLEAIGHRAVPLAAPAASMHEALALLDERASALLAAGLRAIEDGVVTESEDAALASLQADLQQAVETVTAARLAAKARR